MRISSRMLLRMKSLPVALPSEPKGDYELALERVLDYLGTEYFSGQAKEGARLPSVRALASELKVSTAVVHAVYRRLQEEGRLVSTVGRGTFIVSPGQPREAASKRPCIAISSSLLPVATSEWGNAIVAAIMKASTRGDRRVSILPFSTEIHNAAEAVRLLKEEVHGVDGLICFPLPSPSLARDLLSVYAAAGKPVIRVNPPEVSSTENFVSTDYFQSGYAVGRAFLRTGRRRLLFIGVEVPGGSVSAAQRITGMQVALLENPEAEPLRVISVPSVSREASHAVLLRLLESGYQPDAICAFGDFQALGAIDALRERGLSVPEQVSVIGGTGLSIHTEQLSMTVPAYDLLGEKLVQMILTSIANRGCPLPGVYIPAYFSLANTTRAEENALLLAAGAAK